MLKFKKQKTSGDLDEVNPQSILLEITETEPYTLASQHHEKKFCPPDTMSKGMTVFLSASAIKVMQGSFLFKQQGFRH